MGTRTMGSHGKSDGLAKQGPFFNLTLDEVQHHLRDLGKPLRSMNLDELIKSVWSAETETNQEMTNLNTQLASASSTPYLSRKTVDELWQDMKKGVNGGNGHDFDRKTTSENQSTLGEMTLEAFLAKAGVIAESSQEKKNSDPGTEMIALHQQNVNPQQSRWIQYQIPPVQQQHGLMPGHHHLAQQMVNDVAYPETQMTMSSDAQTPGRKRVASGDLMEKTVERRQKRMIKNRESAARSRARKQAYTHELENKVSRLEEENERLKREQEAEKALPYVSPPEPKYQLRRTSSALF
ncbi:hypothetical protein R6Q59_028571 [Mikania micrantha]|uniref:BZIP domain-containing protein n=1 Tax=Mikania micrantha TaxID=192012 RepID=A0A5N6M6G1_9ASTR|nr:hypothetical protein E3N88_31718 [Mikania micrantha]